MVAILSRGEELMNKIEHDKGWLWSKPADLGAVKINRLWTRLEDQLGVASAILWPDNHYATINTVYPSPNII